MGGIPHGLSFRPPGQVSLPEAFSSYVLTKNLYPMHPGAILREGPVT